MAGDGYLTSGRGEMLMAFSDLAKRQLWGERWRRCLAGICFLHFQNVRGCGGSTWPLSLWKSAATVPPLHSFPLICEVSIVKGRDGVFMQRL